MKNLNCEKILVIGCGGIGCELIKLLYLNKKRNITLLDYDTISLSNLNRQFIFKKKDIGKYKCEIMKEIYLEKMKEYNFIENNDKENDNINVVAIVDDVHNFDISFFGQFDIIYNCLDNVDTRSYVNQRCLFVKKSNNKSFTLVDGGSTGFLGQSWYFGGFSECYDCLEKAKAVVYPVCTIRTKPNKFEHCVIWAKTYFLELLVKIKKKLDENNLTKNLIQNKTYSLDERPKKRKFDEKNDLVINKKHKCLIKPSDGICNEKNKDNDQSFVEKNNYSRNENFVEKDLKPKNIKDHIKIINKNTIYREAEKYKNEEKSPLSDQIQEENNELKNSITDKNKIILYENEKKLSDEYKRVELDEEKNKENTEEYKSNQPIENINIQEASASEEQENNKINEEKKNVSNMDNNKDKGQIYEEILLNKDKNFHKENLEDKYNMIKDKTKSKLDDFINIKDKNFDINEENKEIREEIDSIEDDRIYEEKESKAINFILSSLKQKKDKEFINFYDIYFKEITENDSTKNKNKDINIYTKQFNDSISSLFLRNEIIFDKDDQEIINVLHSVAVLRAISFGITKKERLDTENIAGNIIPAICTTNSIVASLMYRMGEKIINFLTSNKKLSSNEIFFNYFLTKGGKIINKMQALKWNSECLTCNSRKFVYKRLFDGSNIENSFTLKYFISKLNEIVDFKLCDISIILGNILIFDRYFRDNLNLPLEVDNNEIITVKNNEENIAIYVLSSSQEDLYEVN